MAEKIRKWLSLLTKWWGILVVYVSIIGATYLGIWAIIEPFSIQESIQLGRTSIARSTLHVILTLLIASNATLLLYTYLGWLNEKKKHLKNSSEKETPLREIPLPTKEQLLSEKVLVKDKRLSEKIFATHVLLALNGRKIEEVFAHDLLRKSSIDVVYADGFFTLIAKSSTPNERRPNV